uniref:Tetratricopeptide repeat protein 38 n=1 Tax=Chromera velia CCMP2878 TaxID=1169474 RepID=A0A0G4G6U2_9ALVE|eukprot:Cvel_20550.t1-p1 / transcript=Cvel_20550.t1 / gene=Cvel_20550 / organism=Chromera_velia_CCMP2878 / gene_product=hypothetical protein / transcript_product=hypothetical protein / location=Cvel_scaffold1854:32629-35160(-) / protein_length=844 / sequence_SO=supercontig / SO=protein_coding / is_pseudo=false
MRLFLSLEVSLLPLSFLLSPAVSSLSPVEKRLQEGFGEHGWPPDSIPEGDAGEHFLLGSKLFHLFWFELAQEQLSKAVQMKPFFALAHAFLALAHKQPLWTIEDLEGAREALRRMHEDAPGGPLSVVDKGLVGAIETLFAEGTGRFERQKEFSDRLRQLHVQHPNHTELCALYGVSLLSQLTDEGFPLSPPDAQEAKTEARGVLKECLVSSPMHSGLLHYSVHAHDFPELGVPEEGLTAGASLMKGAPLSSHALHMRSHLDLRLGNFTSMDYSNAVSVEASDWYCHTALGLQAKGGVGDALAEALCDLDNKWHSLEWQHYALLQLGETDRAVPLLDRIREGGRVMSREKGDGYLAQWCYRSLSRSLFELSEEDSPSSKASAWREFADCCCAPAVPIQEDVEGALLLSGGAERDVKEDHVDCDNWGGRGEQALPRFRGSEAVGVRDCERGGEVGGASSQREKEVGAEKEKETGYQEGQAVVPLPPSLVDPSSDLFWSSLSEGHALLAVGFASGIRGAWRAITVDAMKSANSVLSHFESVGEMVQGLQCGVADVDATLMQAAERSEILVGLAEDRGVDARWTHVHSSMQRGMLLFRESACDCLDFFLSSRETKNSNDLWREGWEVEERRELDVEKSAERKKREETGESERSWKERGSGEVCGDFLTDGIQMSGWRRAVMEAIEYEEQPGSALTTVIPLPSHLLGAILSLLSAHMSLLILRRMKKGEDGSSLPDMPNEIVENSFSSPLDLHMEFGEATQPPSVSASACAASTGAALSMATACLKEHPHRRQCVDAREHATALKGSEECQTELGGLETGEDDGSRRRRHEEKEEPIRRHFVHKTAGSP